MVDLKKKKVLLCSIHSDRSGVPLYTRFLAKTLLDEGWQVMILTKKNSSVFELEYESYKVLVEDGLENTFSASALLRARSVLKKVIDEQKPTLVILNGAMLGVVGRTIKLAPSINRLLIFHGIPFEVGIPWIRRYTLRLIESILLNISNTDYIAISEKNFKVLEALRNKRALGSLSLLTNPNVKFGNLENTKNLKISSSKILLISIAAFRPQKNHRRLFETLCLLNTDFSLCLAGTDTDSKKIKKLAKDILGQNYHERVQFLGTLKDVSPLFADNSILLITSDYEGLPLCGIEALAHGRPIVTTDVSGAQELCANGCGEISLSSQPKAIADKVRILAKKITDDSWDPKTAKNHFNKKFHQSIYKSQIVSLLNKYVL